jgi:hypothetical protein
MMSLPQESFVAFEARRILGARLAFVNRDLGKVPDLLDRCAYLVPSELEDERTVWGGSKTFMAERYGGRGIGYHGGGARCGFDGTFQVKGIGTNPLCGAGMREAEFWHWHGGEPLAGAMQEAVWGEVFQHALPFGATRVVALIATGTDCWFPGPQGTRMRVPRALTVRRLSLRPAHFERAAYFRPQPHAGLVPDAGRVRAAIACLPDLLPRPPAYGEADWHALAPPMRLQAGLGEMARRLAIQCATAQAKRLMHGSLISSNMCLDGRWLDYGTATALPNHANTKSHGLPASFLTLWQEQQQFMPMFWNLCFYIRKYFGADAGAPLPQAEQLAGIFQDHYYPALRRAFVRLAGFPDYLLDRREETPALLRLALALGATARCGVEHPFTSGVVDLEKFGNNGFGRMMLTLARHHADPACQRRLEAIDARAAAGGELLAAYRTARAELAVAAGAAGIDAGGFDRLCRLNAAKSTRVIHALYRHELAEQCRRVVHAEGAVGSLTQRVQDWIDAIADEAYFLYHDSGGPDCVCWRDGAATIRFDALDGRWCVERGGVTSSHAWEAVQAEPALAGLRAYWGEALFIDR